MTRIFFASSVHVYFVETKMKKKNRKKDIGEKDSKQMIFYFFDTHYFLSLFNDFNKLKLPIIQVCWLRKLSPVLIYREIANTEGRRRLPSPPSAALLQYQNQRYFGYTNLFF